MAPVKFVIKCGNFAVLVDLHVLPLGGGEDASWFTTDRIEEVTALVRDAVDQRVKQYAESLHGRRQHKQKKELAPASALFVEGTNFKLVANFLKRHVNLRCIAKQLYGDLRVFPERYVVCVSCPEDASAHHGNLSLATTEQCEQSRSEYFSRVGETQEPFSSPTKTKKTALQKIAKQAAVQPGHHGSCTTAEQEQEPGQRACLKKQSQEPRNGEPRALKQSASSSAPKAPSRTEHELNLPSCSNGAAAKTVCTQKPKAEKSAPDSLDPNGASLVFRKYEINQGIGKRCKPSDAGEDPHPQKAKRTCLGGPPATVRTRSSELSTKTSSDVYLPLTPPAPVEANAESKAFPVWESKKTTVEVELLTLGKRAQRLPPHKQ